MHGLLMHSLTSMSQLPLSVGSSGLSSLSKELRALHDASDDYSDKQVHANSASRVSLDRVDREDSACALRRSHSVSSNMAPSSWHEGSKYLRP